MKNDFMCIPVSELLKNNFCSATRDVFNEKDVWILRDNQQKVVAYQVTYEGMIPFEGVYCLLEMKALPPDLAHDLPIRAFLTGALKLNQ